MSKYINKISLTIAIIILFVPTIIAFVYINSNDGSIPAVPDNSTVTISISDGISNQDIIDTDVLSLVSNDLNNAQAVIDTSSIELYKSNAYTMTVTVYKNDTVDSKKNYTCYLNSDINKCYFRKETGTVCIFSSKTAEKLLKLEICQKSLTYIKAEEALYVDNGQSIKLTPSEITWKYINTMGESVANNDANATVPTLTVNYPKGTLLSTKFDFGTITDINGFTQSPAEIYVTATKGETTYDKKTIIEFDSFLEGLNLSGDTALNCVLEVIWGKEDLSLGYYGKHIYKFDLIYDLPAKFEISNATIYAGALPLVRAKNLSEGQAVSAAVYKPDGSKLEKNINFVSFENVQIAFLPFDFTAVGGKYKIVLSDGYNETQLNLTIRTKEYNTSSFLLPANIMSEHYGESKKVSFLLTMEDVFSSSEDSKLWKGNFVSPLKVKLDRLITYGDYAKINGEYEERAYCNVYKAAAGSEVIAINNGKVIYSGETSITGKIVVIEHGYGFKSWYWNMDTVNVKVGDTVEKKTVIGTVGNTGLCNETDCVLSFALSINDVFITPELYLNKSVDYFDKNK